MELFSEETLKGFGSQTCGRFYERIAREFHGSTSGKVSGKFLKTCQRKKIVKIVDKFPRRLPGYIFFGNFPG